MEIEKIIPGGQGLATLDDGKKAFFWNVLPGEIVEQYEITKQKSHFIEAIATKISRPSRFRVEPKDACFLSTSPWQIIDWSYEKQLKSELVTEIFREHQINITPPPVITDNNSYFYRNKMEYSLYYNHETAKISLAFHARGSHQKIPIANSSIERPEILTAAQKIIDDLNSRHEDARKYQSLLLRCNQNGEISGGLYENKKPHPKFKNLTDIILNQTYSYSPNGFFQINLPVYEFALNEIKKHIITDHVLDLYAGVGTIGLSVAYAHHLILVEVDKSAFAELEKNCKQVFLGQDKEASQKANSVLPILDKSENVLNHIKPGQTVILDPPRAGCDKKLIDKLNEAKPRTIIYLSCNPTTQARDIKLLLNNYKITTIKTFNFFPRTPHIENLVVLC